ncbi:MAG TPA: stalk domain-containing protein [Syntrophomonadaceae bacterium]|nr:stalk domain-containing protein [Syntrophomonadaceae bacterium]
MKKRQLSKPLCLLLLTCLLFVTVLIPSRPVQAQSGISIVVHGNYLYTDVAPIIINDRTLVPMSAIFNALGAQVYWDSNTQEIKGYRGSDEIILQIGNNQAVVNGSVFSLDTPPIIYYDRTMVPVSFIATSLGESVRWDESTQTVYIGGDTSTLSENQALARVRQVANLGNGVGYLVDSSEIRNGSDYYIVKAYVTVDDGGSSHISTVGWYYVDKADGSVYSWDMTDDSLSYLG